MKKIILKTLGLSLALTFSVCASAQILNTNGDMETFTSPVANNNTWINNDLTNWYVSHGTPSPGVSPSTNLWMWSYETPGFATIGEGIYTEINFIAGQDYQLSYSLWRDGTSNPLSQFHVELTNTLTPGTGGSFIIPTPVSQPLTTQPWTGTGTWVTVIETFTATANYSQLWFYPRLDGDPTPWQAACRVDNVCVRPAPANACDVELAFDFYPEEEACTSTFINTSAYPVGGGYQVLKTIWDFGDGTTGTGDTTSHYYATAGIYDVCMTVWATNGIECCQTTICETLDITEICEACTVMQFATIDVIGGNPFTFNANISPNFHNHLYGYYWDFGDGTTGSGKTVNHPYTTPGTYTVTLTVYYFDEETGECCSFDVSVIVNAAELPIDIGGGGGGVDGEDGDDDGDGGEWSPLDEDEGQINLDGIQPNGSLNVYPNPSTGVFTLLPENNVEIANVTVYDNTGKIVYDNQNKSDNHLVELDLNHLEKGVYSLVINKDNSETKIHKKLLIK